MLLNWLKEKYNMKHITLYVHSQNKKAMYFYKKNNFIEKEYLPEYYDCLEIKSAYYFEYIKS